nr:PREDICTED: paraneoplastic antigen Ma1 [Latimeria chalumnae]|eukprot:XP_014346965.1 PREDICTED: paraneoplastic antigen Ma1 [Latimeria chalumnae]
MEDGDELFTKFLNTLQNTGEKPSEYLQRLQTLLSGVVKRGGIAPDDSNRQLLKQFCRGCWDHSFIMKLQLEQKKVSPPSFAELLLLLRAKEDQRASKVCRMKQRLGNSKGKPFSSPHTLYASFIGDYSSAPPTLDIPFKETEKLKKQIADLQKQLALFKDCS